MESINLKNISDAFEYVKKHYVFEKKRYPALGYLPKKFHGTFALRHVADHLEKSVTHYHSNQPPAGHFSNVFMSPSLISGPAEIFREATVNILLNLLKMSDLVGITAKELRDLESAFKSTKARSILVSDEIELTTLVNNLREPRARATEAADHGSPLQTENLKILLQKSWEHIFSHFHAKKLDLSIVWNMIPDCMKSR